MDWMILPLKRYADFAGRSRRMEYWMFSLFQFLVVMVMLALVVAAQVVTGEEGVPGLSTASWTVFGICFLAWLGLFLVPGIAVAVRRFHDQGHSGWMYLLSLIPYVGGIVMFVFMCLPGTKGPNQYGDDPLNTEYLGDVFR